MAFAVRLAGVLFCLNMTVCAQSRAWKMHPVMSVEVGDVVCRAGTGFWSRYFIAASTWEKRFSHVGIVVSNQIESVKIIHSEANDFTGVGSVRIDSWQSFFKTASECAVFRYDGSLATRMSIAESACRRLGVPFDADFDLKTTNELYCTEFVRIAVNEAVGRELIGVSSSHGNVIVAIDDVYRRNFIRIYDSKNPDNAIDAQNVPLNELMTNKEKK